MKKLLLIGLLFFLLVSCKKNNIQKAPIGGIWIETTFKTDTLVFDNQRTRFILNRGTEIRNGYLLPRYLSGPYSYEIVNDSISLQHLLSCSAYGNNYYFNIDSENGKIKIGNFFVDASNKDVILTFARIH